MRASPLSIVAGSMLLACARVTPPPPAIDLPAPILQYADHRDIAPDELGADAGAQPVASPPPACAPHTPPPPPVAAQAHRVRSGPPVTNHIPPELIMRPIRERATCLRACYDAALATTHDLHGRVVVHFIVDEDGWVRSASVGAETDLPDANTSRCVAAQFIGLSYPSPDGGRVEVHYPVTFEP